MSEASDNAFNKHWYGPFGNFDRGKSEAKRHWDAAIKWANSQEPDQSAKIAELEADLALAVESSKLEDLVRIEKLQADRDALVSFVKKVEQFHGPYTDSGCTANDLWIESKQLIARSKAGQPAD